MRIGLNLLHALPEIGGVWNYIESLLSGLSKHDQDTHYIAFVNRTSGNLVPKQSNFQKVTLRFHAHSRPLRILYENTVLQKSAYQYKLDCMHWFANVQGLINSAPAIVTIYDMQPFSHVLEMSKLKRIYLRKMMSHTIKQASMLLPMSQTTAKDLQRLLKADVSKIAVIPPIIDSLFSPVSRQKILSFRSTHSLPPRFWLYVAHLYPHKNHLRLLEAYSQLKRDGRDVWPLVLRGDSRKGDDDIHQRIRQANLDKDIIWLPRLERTELSTLYSSASALVFPSLYEGGGIPVLEAMACGCPVVASNIPTIKEFANDAVLYFNPSDPHSIAKALISFQENNNFRESASFIAKTFSQHSDRRTAQAINRLLQVYQSLSQ